jgi:radical SAM/Cys-rich protein
MDRVSLNKPFALGRQPGGMRREHERKYRSIARFTERLNENNLFPPKPGKIEVLQVNTGKLCNQNCRNCHVDAGPDRDEIMTMETMQHCLDVMEKHNIGVVDITGGEPEMNPYFRWFVDENFKAGRKIKVRNNLTIIVSARKFFDLPEFFAARGVHMICSLPFYNAERTDWLRGEGVFVNSIKALKLLNLAGYADENKGLVLDLVYNPSGAFLPDSQRVLEARFREILFDRFGVVFNNLYATTNMPVNRFLNHLNESGRFEQYMERLSKAFNPVAAEKTMCRSIVSVGWDGYLYDCDFNQMLGLNINSASNHISKFNLNELENRDIVVDQHCYGCTAGAGSGSRGAICRR